MHNIKLKETAEKIKGMEDISNVPKTLARVYFEDQDRIIDQSNDEALALKAFDQRKLDTKYYSMLETKKNKWI